MTLPPPARRGTTAELRWDDLLATQAVEAVFQPIVELIGGTVVGFEALARGPAGSPYELPAELFRAAYAAARVPELDWQCRAAAYRAALAAGMPPTCTLFVNTEPVSLGVPCPAGLRAAVRAAEAQLRVVIEVTERAVARDPAGLLAGVAQARDAGWGVALDDVGAEPSSLAVMPFVHPDIIKLDLRLIQGRSSPDVAQIVNAVQAQAERTGATILAEGIETREHIRVARSMGATLGQGYWYGRPARLPDPLPPFTADSVARVPLRPAPVVVPGGTPFSLISAVRVTSESTKELLLPTCIHLENMALHTAEPVVLLACFEDARHFTPATRRRYARLVERTVLAGVLGVGVPEYPVPGVRWGQLDDADELRREWNLVVLGPHFAAALVARDRGDGGPDGDRRFDAVITHDRELVIAAGRLMLRRLLAS